MAIWRSEAYKEFIQVQPCCLCGHAPLSEAHHASIGGDGIKGGKRPDTQLVPLCGACHRAVHAGDRKYFEETVHLYHGMWHQILPTAMVRHLTRWIEAREMEGRGI